MTILQNPAQWLPWLFPAYPYRKRPEPETFSTQRSLINGRLWNDIVANEIEMSKFIKQIQENEDIKIDEDLLEALYRKLAIFEEFDKIILEYYKEKTFEYTQMSDLHILQKKGLEKLASNLLS